MLKQHYVLGFAFNKAKTKVLLQVKKFPQWQYGKFNGIGGELPPNGNIKFYSDEFRKLFMVEKFLEETTIETNYKEWYEFGALEFKRAKVYCFSALITEDRLKKHHNNTEATILLDIRTLHDFATHSINKDNSVYLVPELIMLAQRNIDRVLIKE